MATVTLWPSPNGVTIGEHICIDEMLEIASNPCRKHAFGKFVNEMLDL